MVFILAISILWCLFNFLCVFCNFFNCCFLCFIGEVFFFTLLLLEILFICISVISWIASWLFQMILYWYLSRMLSFLLIVLFCKYAKLIKFLRVGVLGIFYIKDNVIYKQWKLDICSSEFIAVLLPIVKKWK